MPTYDWRCQSPEAHEFEAARTIAERDEPLACPACGCPAKRVFKSAPVLAWYPDSTRSPYKK